MWSNSKSVKTMSKIYMAKLLLVTYTSYLCYAKDLPKFVSSETNITVVIGRDATLSCSVENLQSYKIAWLRVDTQTILTIGPHVITKNHRVGIKCGDQTWSLIIRDVRQNDGGQYMCQINTDPMLTQTHHLHISVPPDIINSSSGGEVIIREGEDVSLHCTASGIPSPTIIWRREDSALMKIGTEMMGKWSGVWLNLTRVNRDMNGAFLCIATNGVPPSVSKRILLQVLCRPMVQATKRMIGVYLGETAIINCKIEAFPMPVIYWTYMNGKRLQNGSKYQALIKSQSYIHLAELKINNVSREDVGSYSCHSENILGTSSDDTTIYSLATTSTTTTASTTSTVVTTAIEPYVELEVSVNDENQQFPEEDNYVVVLSQHQMQNLDMSPSS